MKRLAVGVCTFNGAARLPETLAMLSRMDRARVSRVIVIDNASTDETPRIVGAFATANPGFELWSEPTPGKSAALSRFFRDAHEAVLGIVDDDISIEPDWADAMLRRLDASPRIGAVGGAVANEWLDAPPTRLAKLYARSLGDQDLGQVPLRLDQPCSFLMGASMVYRSEAIAASGWLDHRVLDCRRGSRVDSDEDAELCIRIRRAGWEVWYEPTARARHRIPRGRQTPRALAALRESIRRSEPWLAWIAGEVDGPSATANARRARLLYLKNLATDWRPTRRRVRLAERAGSARGWSELASFLRAEGELGGRALRRDDPPSASP